MAAPPPKGKLRGELAALAQKSWRHPVNGTAVRFSFPTLERWYYAARKALQAAVRAGRVRVGLLAQLARIQHKDDEIDAVFASLGKSWDGLDILVHSVGFAPREQLEGGFTESITRDGFRISHDISAYSLAALAKAALPMMEDRNGAILTLTYNAATQVVPNYNVMGLAKASLESCMRFLAADLGPKGIRVNAISAGAVKTLAAAGIGGFRKMLGYAEKASPLRRTVTIEEIGNTAAFLCSDLASGITGETTFVDAGANIMGMVFDEET